MTAKHTPGPWRVFLSPDGNTLIGIGDAEGGGVADCGFGVWRSGQEKIANARLIAAAPELLSALKRLRAGMHVRGLHKEGCGCPPCEALNAIDKAEGRS